MAHGSTVRFMPVTMQESAVDADVDRMAAAKVGARAGIAATVGITLVVALDAAVRSTDAVSLPIFVLYSVLIWAAFPAAVTVLTLAVLASVRPAALPHWLPAVIGGVALVACSHRWSRTRCVDGVGRGHPCGLRKRPGERARRIRGGAHPRSSLGTADSTPPCACGGGNRRPRHGSAPGLRP